MKIILVIVSGLFFMGCNHKKYNHSIRNDVITIEYLNSVILNDNINGVKSKFIKGYVFKDTLIYSNEDESLHWKGIMVLKKRENICLLESNWLDKEKVSRITVYSDKVKHKNNLCVGVSLKFIEPYIDKKSFYESPDGYIYLKDNKNSNINYSIENSTQNEIKRYSEINQNSRIDEIIVNSK